MMQSVYLQRIMKKNAANGYEKTNPKQTQFKSEDRGQISVLCSRMSEITCLWQLQLKTDSYIIIEL